MVPAWRDHQFEGLLRHGDCPLWVAGLARRVGEQAAVHPVGDPDCAVPGDIERRRPETDLTRPGCVEPDLSGAAAGGRPGHDRLRFAEIPEPVGAERDGHRIVEDPAPEGRPRTGRRDGDGGAARGVAEHHVVLDHAAGQEPGRHPPLRASLAAYPRGQAGETGVWAATDIGGVYDTSAVAGVSKSAQRRPPATQQQPGWRGLGVEDPGTGRGTGQSTSTRRGPGRARASAGQALARLPRQSSRQDSSRLAPRWSGMPGAEFGPYPHAANWLRAWFGVLASS